MKFDRALDGEIRLTDREFCTLMKNSIHKVQQAIQ